VLYPIAMLGLSGWRWEIVFSSDRNRVVSTGDEQHLLTAAATAAVEFERLVRLETDRIVASGNGGMIRTKLIKD
jgi:hypothetical protein